MSELSVRQYLHNDGSGLTWGYDKREADKAIADLEESHKKEVGQLLMEIVELKNEIKEQKRLRNMALTSVTNALKVMKIIQHNKFKRCLAMARCVWRDTTNGPHTIRLRQQEK